MKIAKSPRVYGKVIEKFSRFRIYTPSLSRVAHTCR